MNDVTDVVLLQVSRQYFIIIVVVLTWYDIVVGIGLRLNSKNLGIQANSISLLIFVDGIAIDVESHRIVEVVVIIVPSKFHLTHACFGCEACCQASCCINLEVETSFLIRDFKELIVLSTIDIDTVHTVAIGSAIDGLVGSIDSAFSIPSIVVTGFINSILCPWITNAKEDIGSYGLVHRTIEIDLELMLTNTQWSQISIFVLSILVVNEHLPHNAMRFSVRTGRHVFKIYATKSFWCIANLEDIRSDNTLLSGSYIGWIFRHVFIGRVDSQGIDLPIILPAASIGTEIIEVIIIMQVTESGKKVCFLKGIVNNIRVFQLLLIIIPSDFIITICVRYVYSVTSQVMEYSN